MFDLFFFLFFFLAVHLVPDWPLFLSRFSILSISSFVVSASYTDLAFGNLLFFFFFSALAATHDFKSNNNSPPCNLHIKFLETHFSAIQ